MCNDATSSPYEYELASKANPDRVSSVHSYTTMPPVIPASMTYNPTDVAWWVGGARITAKVPGIPGHDLTPRYDVMPSSYGNDECFEYKNPERIN
jgi:hypothetical protein